MKPIRSHYYFSKKMACEHVIEWLAVIKTLNLLLQYQQNHKSYASDNTGWYTNTHNKDLFHTQWLLKM